MQNLKRFWASAIAAPTLAALLSLSPTALHAATSCVTAPITHAAGSRIAGQQGVPAVERGAGNCPISIAATPTAMNDAAGTLEGVAVTVAVLTNDLDPIGGGLTVASIPTQPAHGSAAIAPGAQMVIYTPAAGFSGVDSFVYRAQDVNVNSEDALVTIVISAKRETNAPPQIAPVDPLFAGSAPFTGAGANLNVQMQGGFFPQTLGPKEILFLSYTSILTPTEQPATPPGNLRSGHFEFDLTILRNNQPQPGVQFVTPLMVTITYNPALLTGLKEDTLAVYYWNGTTWLTTGINIIARDTANHTLTLMLAHLSHFAFFAQAQPVPVAVTIASGANPSRLGQPVAFRATVSPLQAGVATPTGPVTFTIAGSNYPIQLGANAMATYTLASLPIGSHSVNVVYGGDANFEGNHNGLVQTVNRGASTIALTSSANPARFGQQVTFRATVSPLQAGVATPAGVVIFSIAGSDYPISLNAQAVATFATASLPVGGQAVNVVYNGDANFEGSQTGIVQTISRAGTTTTLTSNANPAVIGQTVIFTATAAAVAPGAGLPSGTITFTLDSAVVKVASLAANGAVTYATNTLSAGQHGLTAFYGGNNSFNGSTAAALTQNVYLPPTAVNDTASTVQGTAVTIPVLANDLDPSAGGLTITGIPTPPAHGTAAVSAGGLTVVYTATADFSGVDSFVYRAQDVHGNPDTALVTILVSPSGNTSAPAQMAPVDPQIASSVPFTSPDAKVAVQLPPAFFPQPLGDNDQLLLTYTPVLTPTEPTETPPGAFKFGNFEFDLLLLLNGQPQHGVQLAVPITITIDYDPALLAGFEAGTLVLYYWDGTAWVTTGITIVTRDPVNHTITVALAHLSHFAFFAQVTRAEPEPKQKLFLPRVTVPSSGE